MINLRIYYSDEYYAERVISMKKFFSVKEVAEILGVSKSLVYSKICNGQIPSRRIGRRILIPASYVEEILAA